jgi:hypothetical protein
VRILGPEAEVIKIELLHRAHRFGIPRYDQSITPVAECGIELIVRKRLPSEVLAHGRLPAAAQPEREVRLHLNQYRDDRRRIIATNPEHPPFENDEPL